MGFVIISDRVDLLRRSAGVCKILERLFVRAEKAHCRPVFRCHIGDRRTVGCVKSCRTLAKKFDEFADYVRLAQHLGNSQHQIGRRRTLRQFPSQINAYNIRRKKINRLPKHPCLCFDTANAPADDSDAVDHRRVRIRTDQRIREINTLTLKHTFRQIFEIHLMDDTYARRHDAKAVKRLRSPLQKAVPLGVSLKLHLHVLFVSRIAAGIINLHRVINDEIDRHERLDHRRVLAHSLHRRTHRRQIHQQRHTRKILQHNACDDKRYLVRSRVSRSPGGEFANMRFAHLFPAVIITQNGFENNTYRNRQPRDLPQPRRFQSRQ